MGIRQGEVSVSGRGNSPDKDLEVAFPPASDENLQLELRQVPSCRGLQGSSGTQCGTVKKERTSPTWSHLR